MDSHNYGFKFNEIIINVEQKKFLKKAKNKYGIEKILNEIKFYIEINNYENHDKQLTFNVPKLLNYNSNSIELEYLVNSKTLTNLINIDNYNYYINKILKDIKSIHDITISIEKKQLIEDINIETKTKLLSRFNETNWNNIKIFKQIKRVNGLNIKNIDYYINIINSNVCFLLSQKKTHSYSLIHGDIHLGNILEYNNNLYYIDPRGYFGNTKLYGLKEYDYAKLLFGLSGYSFFDNLNCDYFNKLNINDNDNLIIDFIKDYEIYFNLDCFNELTKLLTLTIWLGNNSCFTNINKKITSLFIALYYCEKYISKLQK